MQNRHSDVAEKLSQLAHALAEGPRKGMFRCEDIISTIAAFAGECCLRKSAIFDFDNHDLTPGQAVFSDRINSVLSGDLTKWPDIPVTSTFGALYNILTHSNGPFARWDPLVFPDVAGIYQSYAAARGQKTQAIEWGYVPLTLAPKHAPRMPPLRAAFELRRLAFAVWTPTPDDLLAVSQFSLMHVLIKLRSAIDDAVAIRLAFETLNGMAKMAPVLPKHMQEFAARARAGS